ncbi:MAG TPA: tetratricopeptide repeat protein, partial [Actinomycetota bacterium]|nr:tetratricopeptide repeat protein [Actinomycetota bacterium]
MSNFDSVVIEALEQSLAIDEVTYGPDHTQVASDLNKLGLVLQGLGRLHEARTMFERALDIHERVLGPEHPEVATDLTNLGGAMEHLGEYGAAKAFYQRAISIDEAMYGPSHARSIADLSNLYRVLSELGEVSVDPSLLESALAAQDDEPGHPTLKGVLASLGLIPSDLSAVRQRESGWKTAGPRPAPQPPAPAPALRPAAFQLQEAPASVPPRAEPPAPQEEPAVQVV